MSNNAAALTALRKSLRNIEFSSWNQATEIAFNWMA
jgi:hypothetical protein